MIYRIYIWQYHENIDTYESGRIDDVLKWYRNKWADAYKRGWCAFNVYKDGIELSFEEENELGFY